MSTTAWTPVSQTRSHHVQTLTCRCGCLNSWTPTRALPYVADDEQCRCGHAEGLHGVGCRAPSTLAGDWQYQTPCGCGRFRIPDEEG